MIIDGGGAGVATQEEWSVNTNPPPFTATLIDFATFPDNEPKAKPFSYVLFVIINNRI